MLYEQLMCIQHFCLSEVYKVLKGWEWRLYMSVQMLRLRRLANFMSVNVLQMFPVCNFIYRWVPLKPDFWGECKSVRLKHYPAYPIIIISLIIHRNLATKIRAKRESGLTAVQLKRDPPVLFFLLV